MKKAVMGGNHKKGQTMGTPKDDLGRGLIIIWIMIMAMCFFLYLAITEDYSEKEGTHGNTTRYVPGAKENSK